MLAWLTGAAGCLLPMAIGRLAVARICRSARPYRGDADAVPPLLLSARCRMPMACGILHRRVVLPQDAEHWPAQRMQAVLDHELSHVRRGDCVWQTLGQLARALYWFNPLAWMAYRQLLCESEKACDDAVIVQGSQASSYAEHLMAIATAGRSDAILAAAAIAMARPDTLEGRLMSILDGARCRKRVTALVVAISLVLLCGVVLPLAAIHAQTTAATRTADAGALFLQAAQAIAVESPASSALNYPAYPPMGDAWTAMAAQAWKANGRARDLARQARSSDRAVWPGDEDLHWLGKCRNLTNELTDAALYAHLQGQDAAAIELVRDNLHLAKLLRKDSPTHNLVRPMVAAGMDEAGMYRLLMIASAVRLTADPADGQALQITVARELIHELLDQQSSEELLKLSLGADYEAVKSDAQIAKNAETFSRSNAERTMAAMSLACHLFRADKGRWPNSLDEIVPAFLPRVPADPWGDGTQTFGYVLIKGGLPDGSDRPLVYCRCWSPDGLFFRIDAPQYGRYIQDGSNKPFAELKHGGQFRDVARWSPSPAREGQPTTQPLQGTQVSSPLPSGRLDFRMAVNRGRGDPAMSEAEADRLIKELGQQSPDALEKQHTVVAWFPLDDSAAKDARGMIVGQWNKRWYLLASTDPRHTMLADEAGKRVWGLTRVSLVKDQMDQPAVGFDFDKAGAERFGALTGSHIGGGLAVLVDGQVVSAPTINSAIFNSGIISRSEMTEKAGFDLVARLQFGMPAVAGPASKPTGWEEFGPEVDVVVPAVLGDLKTPQLRLADGKLVSPPPEEAKQPFGAEWDDWVRQSGVDLMAANNAGFQGLMGFDMAAAPLGHELSAKIAWASALRDLRGKLKPGSPALMSAAGTLPMHYVIQTRNGTLGILSILELTENPKGVKIRYRLLAPQPTVQAFPSTVPAKPANKATTQPLSGQAATIAEIERLGGKVEASEKGISVRFEGRKATDEGLAQLEKLQRVTSVSLFSTNNITDAGLRHLEGLTDLSMLGINVTPISDAGLLHVSKLQNLRVLILSFTDVTDAGLVHLKTLGKLNTLLLYGEGITDVGMMHLKALPQLHQLSLMSDEVTEEGVKSLQQALPKCKIDYTAGARNQIKGEKNPNQAGSSPVSAAPSTRAAKPVANLTTAQAAAVARIEELGGKVEFMGAESGRPFTVVSLTGRKVTDDALVCLRDVPQLQHVALFDTRITDAGLAHLEGLVDLEILMLDSPKVTDAGLVHLSKLVGLRDVNLCRTEVTDAGLAHLQGLTELESLHASGTDITDASVAYIKNLSQLRSLSLMKASITDASLEQLGTMTHLQSLYLDCPNVTDVGIGHLQKLTRLESLGLFGTKVSDVGLAQLKVFSRLVSLNLCDTGITDAGLAHIQGLTHLTSLELRATKVTDEGVKKLQQALPQCKIGR